MSEQQLSYFERLRLIKLGQLPKEAIAKSKKRIAPISKRKLLEIQEAKKERGEKDTDKERWFKARRREMVGVCQCGCARKSSKHEDEHFRASCCHIFPKAIFESVAYNPLNFVERNFWDGCHSNMDNRGLDRWPMFADWDDIKAKFHELAQLLTDEERSKKFYSQLEKLVYEK